MEKPMASLEEGMEWLLEHIVATPGANGRFANTLSLLEYIGARKILKSQPAASIGASLLTHVAEEVRHAQVLKRLALRLSDGHLIDYEDRHLLAGPGARRYFQEVDHGAARVTGSTEKWSCYLYTTLLIERRAAAIYPAYAEKLEPLGLGAPIRAILKDEEVHLCDVTGCLATELEPSRLRGLQEMEGVAFTGWLRAMSHALGQELPTLGLSCLASLADLDSYSVGSSSAASPRGIPFGKRPTLSMAVKTVPR